MDIEKQKFNLYPYIDMAKEDWIEELKRATKIVADKIASINHLEVIETKYKNTVGDIVSDSLLVEPNFNNLNLLKSG